MSVFSPDSGSDVAPPGLDLFSLPPNQVAVLKRYFEDVRPISQYNGLNPLTFEMNLQGDVYTDLSKSKLFLKVRILRSDGSRLGPDDLVSPVNLMFHAMFSEIDVRMNGSLVYSSGNFYPYVAYFHNLLRESEHAKKTKLTEQLYYADTVGFFDETNPNGGNFGLFTRHQLGKSSKLIEMAGHLIGDCLMLDRYLVNGVKLGITLKRSSPKFCLMSTQDVAATGENYQVVIEDAFFRLYRLKINPAILVAHSKLLKSVSAKYPYTKRNVKCCNVPPNQTVFHWDHISESPLPRFVIVAFCNNNGTAGSYLHSPFNFINCDLRVIALHVNGMSVPAEPIDVFYDNAGTEGMRTLQVFDRFFESFVGHGINFDREDIGKGYAIYIFNLDPDFSETVQFPLLKSGELSLSVRLGTPLVEGATCILYSERYGMLELDETRNVTVT
ncbi:MAG: hypothetical protein N0E59_18490 [Candidatus Thiodiazotropha taylori]|nr:hypothetical protein [Candidatus Thiodiazotropha taylori]MCW4285108.1 hypothetical protein [Candidatus Thiodiazotropha taylori]